MNKKLIAIAVATVMAAPVAMADVKISGRLGGHLTVKDTDGAANNVTKFGDAGQTRLQFDGSVGNAYVRMAMDERNTRDQAAFAEVKRDQYAGYKFGGGTSAQFGRMGGAAKNIEKDSLIATFLQLRGTVGESATGGAYGSSSFVNHIIEAKFKAGATNIKVQYDVGDNSGASSNEGHTAIAVTGKGGPVNYWVAYNNGTADGNGTATNSPSNMKVGASMKFGKAKVALNYTSMDKDNAATPTAGEATDSIAVLADIGMGNGLAIHAGVATRSGEVAADDATWMRIGVSKKINKGTTGYAGYTTTDYDAASASADTSEVGVGLIVKF